MDGCGSVTVLAKLDTTPDKQELLACLEKDLKATDMRATRLVELINQSAFDAEVLVASDTRPACSAPSERPAHIHVIFTAYR